MEIVICVETNDFSSAARTRRVSSSQTFTFAVFQDRLWFASIIVCEHPVSMPNTTFHQCRRQSPEAPHLHLSGGVGWHLCLIPLLVFQTVLGPVSTLAASVAMSFMSSAISCYVILAAAFEAVYSCARTIPSRNSRSTIWWSHVKALVPDWCQHPCSYY